MEEASIIKLVHGGQGLGVLPDGRKVFVWNALPGEKVLISLKKSKKSYAEGITQEVLVASPERVEPKDEAYLSTSPWQITTFEAENRYKQEILTETIQREGVKYDQEIPFHAGKQQWHYRNKMEYSFWGDDAGLHLALFHRGSHGKQIITGSQIARPEIDATANQICQILNKHSIRASQLKTVVVRCSQEGHTVAAIFVKDENFPAIPELEAVCKGLAIYFSNPKSPASVLTKKLQVYGDITLVDRVLDTDIAYDVNSFFQVNLPIFETALKRVADFSKGNEAIIDFYSGVGTIGISLAADILVESDENNIEMARRNVGSKHIEATHASAESSLDYIKAGITAIFDPPRAGLHAKVIERIRESKPEKLIYLSCNPITQARDIALLQDLYEIKTIEGYNFFPRTPHIESLAVMIRNNETA